VSALEEVPLDGEAICTPGAGEAAAVCEQCPSLTYEEALEVFKAAHTIAISGHVNPDGDAIGSALALRELLEAMGKEAVVLLGQDDAAPELYEFLPGYEFVLASAYEATPDLFVVVDAPTLKRLGTAERLISDAGDTIVIDHHANYGDFAHYYLGDATASATSSIIWGIIKASGVEPTVSMATYCYVGIMTDTGRFAFHNTSSRTFQDVAEMVELGVSPAIMSEKVYENKTVGMMRIEALALERMQFSHNGSVGYSFILQEDLEALGIKRDATEQLPTILRSIKGVEVAALFREEGTEGVRVNLRSRKGFDVGAFACTFGGGGHAGAAGLTIDLPVQEAVSLIVGRLVQELSLST